MKSIVSNERKCFICEITVGLHKHHIFYGTANRRKSEQDGCWVYLCGKHHNLSNQGVHFNKILDTKLKRYTERKWCANYKKTPDEFRERYGRNYL